MHSVPAFCTVVRDRESHLHNDVVTYVWQDNTVSQGSSDVHASVHSARPAAQTEMDQILAVILMLQ